MKDSTRIKELTVRDKTCPTCGKVALSIQEVEEKVEVRGDPMIGKGTRLVCSACESSFHRKGYTSDPARDAYEQYRKLHGFISPERIRQFRDEKGYSQKQLAHYLGFGDFTLSRYENGALPTEAHNRLMCLVMDFPENLEILIERFQLESIPSETEETAVEG